MFKSTGSRIILFLVIAALLLLVIFHSRPKKTATVDDSATSPVAEPAVPAVAAEPAQPESAPKAAEPVVDYWENCPPADRKSAVLSQEKEPSQDEDGVHIEFSPVSAFGDLVTVKQTVVSTTLSGPNGSVSEFVTCDLKENRRLVIRDLVSPASLAKTAEAFGPDSAQAAESMGTMDNFAVIGIDVEKNLLYLLLGDSGPHGELNARYLDVKLDPDESSSLSRRMDSPKPKAQPFESDGQTLFDMPNEDEQPKEGQ